MSHQLMDDVWLGGVERHRVMSDVLSRVEDLEGKSIKELPLAEEASNWSKSPACFLLEELRNVLKLRYVVLCEPTVLLH